MSGSGAARAVEVLRVLQLSALHKWRLGAIADYVIGHAHGDNDQPVLQDAANLHTMMALEDLTGQLCDCQWLQKDSQLSQIQMDIDVTQQALDLGQDSVQCERLQHTATGKYEMDRLIEDLEAEYSTLELEIRAIQLQHGEGHWANYFRGDKCFFLLSLVDLSNICAVALFVTGISHDALDGWLCVYPVVHLLCLVPTWVGQPDSTCRGFLSWLKADDDPINHFFRAIHLACVCVAFVGMSLLLSSPENVHINIARTLTSATCFLIFVHSKHLFLVAAVLVRALALVAPFFGTMGVLALIFGKICQDLYGPDVDLNRRFQDLKEIVLTTFQLFTACGWPGLMWEFTSKTNLGTSALFCAYMFVSSLLFGQLVLGVIISISEEVLSYKSIRFMKPVHRYLVDLPEHERDAFLKAIYRIGFQLAHIHQEIYQLTHRSSPVCCIPEVPNSKSASESLRTAVPRALEGSNTRLSDNSFMNNLPWSSLDPKGARLCC